MILTPPLSWRDVPVGAQVLIDGVPRTVLVAPGRTGDCAWLEGVPGPHWIGCERLGDAELVQLVIMDVADAMANLQAAGLTATPITEG